MESILLVDIHVAIKPFKKEKGEIWHFFQYLLCRVSWRNKIDYESFEGHDLAEYLIAKICLDLNSINNYSYLNGTLCL